MISNFEARSTAGEWHSGQWSALYAFSSSGYIDDDLIMEIEKNLKQLENPAIREKFDDPSYEVIRLENLLEYIKDHSTS